MHPFELTISVVGAIALGIMGLVAFFRILAAFDSKVSGDPPSEIRLKGILDRETPVNIHLASGSTFENVRLVGFTDSNISKGRAFPYELHGMAILEHDDGRRTLVQAKLIRMIEVPPKAS